MTGAISSSNDPRMRRLAETLRVGRAAIVEFQEALRYINDEALQDSARRVIETAQSILARQMERVTPTIADDIATLRTSFSRLDIPREDSELGPLQNLKSLRGAKGNLIVDFDDILKAARAIGWRPSDSDLPDIVGTEIPREGVDVRLRALVSRMEKVEKLLDEKVKPEGVPAPERTAIQISLVNVFVSNMKIELALAKLEAQVKNIIDLSALGRVIENVAELTADFAGTVSGIARKMTVALRNASEELRPQVRRVTSNFKGIIRKAASAFAGKHNESNGSPRFGAPEVLQSLSLEFPPDFDLKEAHDLILSGVSPPIHWRPWIRELRFSRTSLKDLNPLASLTALQKLSLDETQVSDLAPLAGLTALRTLSLVGAPVVELGPLASLTALQKLSLDATPVRDLAPLANLATLTDIFLSRSLVSDLAPLSKLVNLNLLFLDETRVWNLVPLAGLTRLYMLFLDGTDVSNLLPLRGLISLKELHLDRTKVITLAPLSTLRGLQTIRIRETMVNDLAPLAALENLQHVWVENDDRRVELSKTIGERKSIVKVS